MRNSNGFGPARASIELGLLRASIVLVALGLAASLTGCGKFDEGINAKNISGVAIVPKAVLGTNQMGVLYVGVYAGVDERLGYASPEAAPQSSTAGADTFPFGGTAAGTFYSRDARFICTEVSGQEVIDAGANLEIPFDIFQFPFYDGAVVWAFIDIDNSTCNVADGYYDYFQYLVDVTAVTETVDPGVFVLDIDVTQDLTYFVPLEVAQLPDPPDQADDTWSAHPIERVNGNPDRIPDPRADVQLVDEAGHFWFAPLVATTSYGFMNPANYLHQIVVTAASSESNVPQFEGTQRARLYSTNAALYYGTTFQDILNFPSKYIAPGDIVSSVPGPSNTGGSRVIHDLSPITITLDTVVTQ